MGAQLTFADWLKARRKFLDMTQNDLAQRANCSLAAVKKIEAGDLRPSAQLAELLAVALNVPAHQREEFVHAARAENGALSLDVAPTAVFSAPSPFPPPASPRPFNNLPAQLTGLLGREREVAAAVRLLRQPGVRLLTLTGPPGAGKTRLSIEIAEMLAEDFADGVCFTALAPVTDPTLVASAIAQTLGVSESVGVNLMTALQRFVARRSLLLVMDNFEQVIDAAAIVKELLTVAPKLKVIVSSREVLHLYGEREFPVPPLALPDLNRLPPVEALALYPSVALFVERASAVQPTFELTAANAAPIARICAWLDGLPLAIEMAAVQVRWLTPERVLQQITRQLAGLTGGPRNLSPRQQTMRGAIEWSYNLLEPAERQLFTSLAVFSGGFTLDAAQDVIDGMADRNPAERVEAARRPEHGEESLSPFEVEATLFALVEKSLLLCDADARGVHRFSQLEVIRSYASEKLAEHPASSTFHRRHAEYYCRLAEEAANWLNGADQTDWLGRLDAERSNMRASLEWLLRCDPSAALRMGVVLSRDYWTLRGQYSEGRTWLTRCMEAASSPEQQNSPQMSWALALDGRLAASLGDSDAGRQQSLLSLERFRAAGDNHGCAIALRTLARIAVTHSDYELATSYYQQALPLCLAAGDRHEAGQVLNGLGFIAKNRGEYGRAIEWYEKALGHFQALGNRAGQAHTLTLISTAHYWQGDFARAAQLGQHCVAMRRELGATPGIAFALDLWGMALARSGDFGAGRTALAEALEIFQQMGDRAGVALALNDLGQIEHLQGDFAQAVSIHQQAFQYASGIGEKYRMAFCLEGAALALAELAATDKENGRRAVQLLAAAAAIREEIGSPVPPSEQPLHRAGLTRLQTVLPDQEYVLCWSVGSQAVKDAAWLDHLLAPSSPARR
jgi:predicted ATPase/transcriptional regulator with XRE-family HTH domain